MESASRSSFSEEIIEKVWRKAKTIPGSKPELWRKDSCGTKIYRHSYGLQSDFGWEIDHITPNPKAVATSLRTYSPYTGRTTAQKVITQTGPASKDANAYRRPDYVLLP